MTSSYRPNSCLNHSKSDLASAIEAMRCLQADVRLYAAFAATRSIAIGGCKVDHVFQIDAAQRRGVTANDILRAAGTVHEAGEERNSELVAKVVRKMTSSYRPNSCSNHALRCLNPMRLKSA